MCRRVRSPFCSRKGGRRKRRRAAAAAAGRLQACNWKRARVLCSGACCIKCYELKRSLECYVSVEFYEILLMKSSILRYVSIRNILYNRPLCSVCLSGRSVSVSLSSNHLLLCHQYSLLPWGSLAPSLGRASPPPTTTDGLMSTNLRQQRGGVGDHRQGRQMVVLAAAASGNGMDGQRRRDGWKEGRKDIYTTMAFPAALIGRSGR